jgi:AraC-like DNA-binding protein
MRRISENHPATLHTVTILYEMLKEQGLPARQALQGSGITEPMLAVPHAMVTQTQELRVCANALALSGDAQLGLRLGARMHVLTYGLLGFTMLVSPTLAEALAAALKFESLLGSWFRLTLREEDGTVVLAARGYEYLPELRDFAADLCLASLGVILRDLTGGALARPTLCFRRSGSAPDRQALPRGFVLRFDQPEDALCFDAQWLRFALPLANRTSHLAALHDCHAIAEHFAQRSLLLRKVREWLAQNVLLRPSLAGLARHLQLTPRTLRRRLADLGSSYLALLDDVRRDAAIQMIEQTTLPVAEVAGRLGYSESASFRHAFKRWTALSPSQYRA